MRRNDKNKGISILVMLPMLGFGSKAIAVDIPNNVNPDRFNQNVQPMIPQKPEAPALDIKPEEEEAKKLSPKDQKKNQVQFKLASLAVEGSNSIPIPELQALYAQKVGTKMTLPELKDLAQSVENYYRSKGFFIARVIIPPQRIKKEAAEIKFLVLEGRISKVNFIGASCKDEPILARYLSSVTDAPAITEKELEKAMLLANDLPGIRAQAIIAPSPTVLGAAELNVKVTEDNPNAFISLDNRGTRYLGNKQLRAGGTVYNLFGPDLFYADVTTTIPDSKQLQSFSELYKFYFGKYGTNVTLNAKQTITKPGLDLATLGLQGKSNKIDISITQPFIRTRFKNLSLTGGLYLLDSKNEFTASNSVFYNDTIRAAYISANYTQIQADSNFNAELKFTKGMDVGSATKKDDTLRSRTPDASGTFLKTNLNINYTQNFTDKVSLFLSGNAQHSSNALLSSEEFSYGGETFGNAYDASEIVGDRGVAGKIELRYTTNVPQMKDINYIQLFSSYDKGKIWNMGASDQAEHATAASFSFGVRFGLLQKISGSIELAKPFIRDSSSDNTRRPRLFAKFVANF